MERKDGLRAFLKGVGEVFTFNVASKPNPSPEEVKDFVNEQLNKFGTSVRISAVRDEDGKPRLEADVIVIQKHDS